MEYDAFRFDFSVFNVDFVAAEHDRNILADSDQIPVPVGHILVGDSRGDVKHDDGAVALDIVAVAKPPELLLAGGVPHIKPDCPPVRVKDQRVHFHSQRGHVFFLELAGQVTLHERGLAGASVSDQDALKRGHLLFLGHDFQTPARLRNDGYTLWNFPQVSGWSFRTGDNANFRKLGGKSRIPLDLREHVSGSFNFRVNGATRTYHRILKLSYRLCDYFALLIATIAGK